MSYVNPYVLDNGLQALIAYSSRLTLTSQPVDMYIDATEPPHYLGAAAVTITGPSNADPTGRKVTVSAIANGQITLNGNAAHWCIVDDVTQRLLWQGDLDNPLAVEVGNMFTLEAFDLTFPGIALTEAPAIRV